jgi:hypothetical protein
MKFFGLVKIPLRSNKPTYLFGKPNVSEIMAKKLKLIVLSIYEYVCNRNCILLKLHTIFMVSQLSFRAIEHFVA